MVIQYQLLLMNVEATVCDDDIVFFKDPAPLLRSNTDFQVGSDGDDREFSQHFKYDKLNVGFFHVIPSELVIRFYHHWLKVFIAQNRLLDQEVLSEMLEPYRYKDNSGLPQQIYNVESFVHMSSATLSITWFDPLDVSTGKLFYWQKAATVEVARKRNITSPYIFHAAWLKPRQKPIAFAHSNVWMAQNDICDPDNVIKNP
jgi:hypothetical protein